MNRIERALRVCVAAAVIGFGLVGSAMAQTTSTIPDIGVEGATFVTDFSTKVGAYLAAVLGLALAIYGVKLVLRWIRGLAK